MRGMILGITGHRPAAVVCLLGLLACGTQESPGVVEGELAVYIADGLNGTSETHYALRAPDGTELPLRFDREVDVPAGTRLAVWGQRFADHLQVESYRVADPAPNEAFARQTSPLIAGTPYPARSFAFVLVDIGGGLNVTVDGVLGSLLNNPDSLRTYYLNDSYGRQDITADVIGPLSFPMTTCSTGDTSALARALRPMVNGNYQHYLWYLGTRLPACAWAGLASLGIPDSPTKDTWYNGSTGCVVLVQEPGHNFGMQHSSSLTCPGASFADDPNTCAADEYGDIFDPMGGACRHMNAWQKAYQGWFGGCNGVTVTASGTFTLLPFEARCDGAQFLKVKAAKPRMFNRPAAGGGGASVETLAYYYLELRTPLDFDGTVGNRTALTPQVLVHAGDDVRSRTQRGLHTYLLDMAPSTAGRFGDAGLKTGMTFSDPAGGVRITATAVSAAQATIDIEIQIADGAGAGDAPTCLDGTPFTTPGPGPESCSAAAPGTGGATGTGGAAATGGISGSGGETGSGGAPVPDGGGDTDGGALHRPTDDGCGCDVNRKPSGPGVLAIVLGLMMVALSLSQRRR